MQIDTNYYFCFVSMNKRNKYLLKAFVSFKTKTETRKNKTDNVFLIQQMTNLLFATRVTAASHIPYCFVTLILIPRRQFYFFDGAQKNRARCK